MESHSLKPLTEIYLKAQDLSAATLKKYRICYKYYLKYLTDNKILYAKTSDVIRFRESLRKTGYSPYYIHTYISSLRGLYHFLKINQPALNLPSAYAYNIMDAIKNEKIKNHLKKPLLTLDEARHLLTYTKTHRKIIYDYRNYAIITLMITAGFSAHEIIHLKQVDYQIKNHHPVLIVKKHHTHHKHTVYLSKGVVEAIDDYLNKRKKKDNPYLFVSQNNTTEKGHLSRTFFYNMFKKVTLKCGLSHTNITPHALRHTAAYFNLIRGGSVESTKKLLRHVDIQSTLVYVDYIEKMNDQSEEAIDAFILKEDENDILYTFLFDESYI